MFGQLHQQLQAQWPDVTRKRAREDEEVDSSSGTLGFNEHRNVSKHPFASCIILVEFLRFAAETSPVPATALIAYHEALVSSAKYSSQLRRADHHHTV
jgi:hypothetical protein